MPVNVQADLSDLQPHLANPRLPRAAENVHAAFRQIAQQDPSGLITLAQSIADNPWDDSTLLMLTTSSGNPARGPYTVREGNRRLTAIRGLQSPDMFEGVLTAPEMRTLREASSQAKLPSVISSLVFGSDEEADLLDRIARRHGGESAGAGVRPWDVRMRTRALGGQDAAAVALLDHLDGDGGYGDTSGISPTTLTRILSTPEIRDALGIAINRGKLQIGTNFSDMAMHRLLGFMREDDFTVAKVMSSDQRRNLATDLYSHRTTSLVATDEEGGHDQEEAEGGSEGEDSGINAGGAVSATGGQPNNGVGQGSTTIGGATRSGPPRKKLVPADFPLGTGNARINDLLKQAKKLDIEAMPAICGISTRVLLELIVDEYRSRSTPPGNNRQKLRDKVLEVALQLEARGLLSLQERQAVEHVCNSPAYGVTNIVTLHSYVHSLAAPVNTSDVRMHWDHLDRFLRTAWSNLP